MIEEIISLHNSGMSYAKIAEKFGKSKNSIAKQAMRYRKKHNLVYEKPTPKPSEKPEKPLIDTSTFVSLLELTGCRWPEGEGKDTVFCNKSRNGHHAYCETHRKKAYRLS